MTQIRTFRDEDAPALWQVFRSAIHGTASADYTPEQIDAWAPKEFDPARWATRMRGIDPFVAERDSVVVGYADVQATGYIDHFFVSAEVARQGVGSLLMTEIHALAASRGLESMYSDVSITARPFFEKWGFAVERAQTLAVGGAVLNNFRMRKVPVSSAVAGSPVEGFVPSAVKPPGRRVWTVTPRQGASACGIVFLDAELYLERVGALPVLQALVEAGHPPMAALFVSNDGAAARHVDYTCDADYASFVVNDIVPWWLQRDPAIDSGHLVLVGLSLSGLAAADVALRHRHCFRAAVCQSPSFWWADERFASTVSLPPAGGPRLWISVGSGETSSGVSHPPTGLQQNASQIDACARGAEALRSAGCDVNYRVFEGGHDPQCWRDELPAALAWATR